MSGEHLVVDGSNIATEGRTAPSLDQLNTAVTSFIGQHAFENVVVVVDATFPNRIDQSEVAEFEAAVLAGEMLTPPAGAVGRGDAFVLQIAEQTGATVLSNDSFQEFHGDHEWLFEPGRLWGGKPVPQVGWVFVERTPVQGPASRRARQAKRKQDAGSTDRSTTSKRASGDTAASTGSSTGSSTGRRGAGRRGSGDQASTKRGSAKAGAAKGRSGKQGAAARTSSEQGAAERSAGTSDSNRGRRSAASSEPLNSPGAFLSFVTDHPLGSQVTGTVVEFSSHGAYVEVGETRCYVSLKAMGDPPPRSPRDVLAIGASEDFIVRSVDTPRRGIDLALPDGRAAVGTTSPSDPATSGRRSAGGGSKQPSTQPGEPSEEDTVAVKKKAPAKRKAAAKKKAPAKRKAAAKKKAPAKRKAAAKKKAPAKRKAAAKKKAPAKRKAAAKKKAPAKRKAAAKKKAPAKRKAAAKRKAPARRR